MYDSSNSKCTMGQRVVLVFVNKKEERVGNYFIRNLQRFYAIDRWRILIG